MNEIYIPPSMNKHENMSLDLLGKFTSRRLHHLILIKMKLFLCLKV